MNNEMILNKVYACYNNIISLMESIDGIFYSHVRGNINFTLSGISLFKFVKNDIEELKDNFTIKIYNIEDCLSDSSGTIISLKEKPQYCYFMMYYYNKKTDKLDCYWWAEDKEGKYILGNLP